MTRLALVRDRLRERIARIPIIDNHEHLLVGDFAGADRMHLIRHLSHSCLRHDLRSAGFPGALCGETRPSYSVCQADTRHLH